MARRVLPAQNAASVDEMCGARCSRLRFLRSCDSRIGATRPWKRQRSCLTVQGANHSETALRNALSSLVLHLSRSDRDEGGEVTSQRSFARSRVPLLLGVQICNRIGSWWRRVTAAFPAGVSSLSLTAKVHPLLLPWACVARSASLTQNHFFFFFLEISLLWCHQGPPAHHRSPLLWKSEG